MADKSCVFNQYIQKSSITPSDLCPFEQKCVCELITDASRRSIFIYEQMVDLLKINCNCGTGSQLLKLITTNLIELDRVIYAITLKSSDEDFLCFGIQDIFKASTAIGAIIPSLNKIAITGLCDNPNCLDAFYNIRQIIIEFIINVENPISMLDFVCIRKPAKQQPCNCGSKSTPKLPCRQKCNSNAIAVNSAPTCCNAKPPILTCVDQTFSRILLLTISLAANNSRLILDLFLTGAIFKPEPLNQDYLKLIFEDSEQIRFNADTLFLKLPNVNSICPKGAIASTLFDVSNLSRYIATNLRYVEYLKASESEFDRCRSVEVLSNLNTLANIVTISLATIDVSILATTSPNDVALENKFVRSFFNGRAYSMEVL